MFKLEIVGYTKTMSSADKTETCWQKFKFQTSDFVYLIGNAEIQKNERYV